MKLSPPHWPLSCLFVVSWGWDLGTEPWPPALRAQRAHARSHPRVGYTAFPSQHCSLTLGHPSWPVQLSVQEASERLAGAGSQVWGLRRAPGPPVWYALCPLPSSWLYSVPVTPSWGQPVPHSRRDSGQVVHSWNGEQRELLLECAGGCKWRAHPWDVSRPVWAQGCEMAGCVWRGHGGCGRSQGLLRAQNRKQQLQTWPQGC